MTITTHYHPELRQFLVVVVFSLLAAQIIESSHVWNHDRLPTSLAAATLPPSSTMIASSEHATTKEKNSLNKNIEDSWWTPWINVTSQVFRPWQGNSPDDWCIPISATEHSQGHANISSPVVRGRLYIKIEKASSSTCAGINKRISINIGLLLRATMLTTS